MTFESGNKKMTNPGDNNEEIDEIYANSLAHFLWELETLAEEPKKQCEITQYDNVAWELKDFFIRSAEGVLNLPGGNLSKEQKQSIAELMTAVTAIPDAVVNVLNYRECHLRAMRNPWWAPIRTKARALLSTLAPQRKWMKTVLKIDDS